MMVPRRAQHKYHDCGVVDVQYGDVRAGLVLPVAWDDLMRVVVSGIKRRGCITKGCWDGSDN